MTSQIQANDSFETPSQVEGQGQDTPCVLLVDDDQRVLNMLEAALTVAGYRCSTAQSADKAIELLHRELFDIAVLDIHMPVKSGMELLKDIKVEYPDLAIMMLTSEGETSTAVEAMREGAYDYANKPISVAELTIRIERALSRRSLLLENRVYRKKLEELVHELEKRLEQRDRETSALNRLFKTYLTQNEGAYDALAQLQTILSTFNSELESLATIVGIVPHDDKAGQGFHQSEEPG